MKKLTLNIDDLRVHSFQTAEGTRDHGTVDAYADTVAASCNTCPDSMNNDTCMQFSVYVDCQEEVGP
jgi:hypothetical protein